MIETAWRLAAVAALVGAVLALAWIRRRRKGPFVPRLDRLPQGLRGATDAPLVAFVFTSRLCGACRETPEVVRAAAPEVPVVPLPVERHGGLARAFGLRETPTLVLADARGRVRYACEGNPSPEELWTYAREAWDSLEEEGQLPARR